MAIISILRDTPNNVSLVRMISTDTLATVTSADYMADQMVNIRNLNSGFWQWFETDLLVVSCADQNAILTFTDATFSTAAAIAEIGGNITAAQIQDQAFTYAEDTGAADAYVIALTPALTAYEDGQYVCFKASADNTGASTINVNGLGAKDIVTNDNVALAGGEILQDGDYILIYNDTFGKYVLVNSSAGGGGSVTPQDIQNQTFISGVDIGIADAYELTLTPALGAYQTNQLFIFEAANDNTTASTFGITGLGTAPIYVNRSGVISYPLHGGEIIAGQVYALLCINNGAGFLLLNPSTSVVASQLQSQFYTLGTDTGIPNAYVVDLTPALTSYDEGVIVNFIAANTSTITAPTIDVNGLGVKTIYLKNGLPIGIGDVQGGEVATLLYSVNNNGFVLQNPASSNDTLWYSLFGLYNTVQDTGAADAYAGTPPLSTSVYNLAQCAIGAPVYLMPANTNTGASTFDIGAIGALPINTGTATALTAGQIVAGQIAILAHKGTYWELLNPAGAGGGGVTAADIQEQAYTYAVDAGAANAYAITLTPSPGSYADGQYFCFKANNRNTAASTLNVNGIGNVAIVLQGNIALVGSEILLDNIYCVVYNATIGKFILLNPSGTVLQNQVNTYAVAGGASNTYSATYNPPLRYLRDGQFISFTVINNNTGASTIDVDGLGATPLRKNGVGGASIDLTANNIVEVGVYTAIYSDISACWVLQNPT